MVDTLRSEGTIPQLIIRSDATTKMGSGHLMRCLALGQAWKDRGGEVQFVTACTNEELIQCLREENFTVHHLDHPFPDAEDWQFTRGLLTQQPGALLVLDGYHFTSDYQKQVKDAGYKLMVIDDMNDLPHYYADIVLNQNIYANNLRYSCEPHTTLLLGSMYALLRREFLKWRGWKRTVPTVARKVLVTLGGGDPDNVTMKVIQALELVPVEGLEATVLVGSVNPHYEELRSAAQGSRVPIRLERRLTNISDIMSCAEVVVSAGGGTCWELAFMGLPAVLLPLAENQRVIARGLRQAGIAVNLGQPECVPAELLASRLAELIETPHVRRHFSERARLLIDGFGVERLISALKLQPPQIGVSG